MSSLRDIGQLIQVPIEQIEFDGEYDMPPYQVAALSERLRKPELRNWVPVIVQEPTPRQYQVVSNGHILSAMKAAGHEYVWVVVVPDDSDTEIQIKLLTGKLQLRVNICTADYETILAALSSCRQQLSLKFDVAVATERILKAPGRRGWKNLQPLTKLQCGLSATSLKVLGNVFETIPEKIEIKPIIINTASKHELLEALESLSTLANTKLDSVNLEALADSIVGDSERQYWQDLKPLTKLKNGLTSAKLVGLESVLKLKPVEPPTPNTVNYLLNLMSLTDLKKEAKSRNIVLPKKVSKSELVILLSQS
jgi:hypothetical protein